MERPSAVVRFDYDPLLSDATWTDYSDNGFLDGDVVYLLNDSVPFGLTVEFVEAADEYEARVMAASLIRIPHNRHRKGSASRICSVHQEDRAATHLRISVSTPVPPIAFSPADGRARGYSDHPS